jgi:hypothetical protein
VTPYLSVSISPVDAPLRAASPLGRRGMGEARREERSGFARLLFLPACTDTESLEHSRARSLKIAERVFPSVHPSAGGFLSLQVMRLLGLTHGFLVSFAEPRAFPGVLIPLDTYGEGFCREL